MKTFNEFVNEAISFKDLTATEEYFLRAKTGKKLNRDATLKLIDKMTKELDVADTNLDSQTNKISTKEEDALATYLSKEYIEINKQLRDGKLSAKNQKTVNLLDSALEKNTLKNDLIVFRSVDPKGLNDTTGYKSCTLNPLIAYSFARGGAKLYKLKIPKGTHYIYANNFLGTKGGEFEVILPRDISINQFVIE